MNGSNSGTSGEDVAGVGYWNKSILTGALSNLQSIVLDIGRILDGELSAAALDFVPRGYADLLSDKQMAEIARRLIVTFEDVTSGNVVLSPTPPEDLSKIWGQTDPTSGALLGQLQKWDADQGKWVPTAESPEAYAPPTESAVVRVSAAAGNSTHIVPLGLDMGRVDYFLSITPTSWNGTVFGAAPASFPSAHGWVVTNKSETEVTIAFFAVPTGGLVYEVWARNPETA